MALACTLVRAHPLHRGYRRLFSLRMSRRAYPARHGPEDHGSTKVCPLSSGPELGLHPQPVGI
jgi:hypothetical protein